MHQLDQLQLCLEPARSSTPINRNQTCRKGYKRLVPHTCNCERLRGKIPSFSVVESNVLVYPWWLDGNVSVLHKVGIDMNLWDVQ